MDENKEISEGDQAILSDISSPSTDTENPAVATSVLEGQTTSELTTLCQKTGEASSCDDHTKVGIEESGGHQPSFDKSILNETGETNFSDNDNEVGEEEGKDQQEPESSSSSSCGEAPAMRSTCCDSDYDDSERDEEEDFYSDDDGASQTSSEGEVLDSTKGTDVSIATPLEENKDEAVSEITKKGNEKTKEKQPDRRDPTYVPREGAFFLHDARDESDECDEKRNNKDKIQPNNRRPGMLASRWTHDLYVERQQNPRSTEEIIRRYGYDIRKHGLDDVKPQPQRGIIRQRGRFTKSQNNANYLHNNTVAFKSDDFPSLDRREGQHNRDRGGRYQRSKPVEATDRNENGVERNQTMEKPRRREPELGSSITPVVQEFRPRRANRHMDYNYNGNRNMRYRDREPPSTSKMAQPQAQPRGGGKRYSVIRRQTAERYPAGPPKAHTEQRVEFAVPDAETRQFYRSVDPSIVAALVQQHQMANPEAFEAAKGTFPFHYPNNADELR